MNEPTGLAFDSAGNLYVSNEAEGVGPFYIEKFSPAGVDLGVFSNVGVYGPSNIAFDASGNLFLADYGNGVIEKYTPSGSASVFASGFPSLAGVTDLAFNSSGTLFALISSAAQQGESRSIRQRGDLGAFVTGLNMPTAMAFDKAGNLYIVDEGLHIFEKYPPTGVDLGVFATRPNMGDSGLGFDSSGNLYVVNELNIIEKYSPTRTDLGTVASGATLSGAEYIAIQPGALLPEPNAAFSMLLGFGILISRRYRKA